MVGKVPGKVAMGEYQVRSLVSVCFPRCVWLASCSRILHLASPALYPSRHCLSSRQVTTVLPHPLTPRFERPQHTGLRPRIAKLRESIACPPSPDPVFARLERNFVVNWFDLLAIRVRERVDWAPSFLDQLRDGACALSPSAPGAGMVARYGDAFATYNSAAYTDRELAAFCWRQMSFDEIPLQADYFNNICQAANHAISSTSRGLWVDTQDDMHKSRWSYGFGVKTGTTDFAAYSPMRAAAQDRGTSTLSLETPVPTPPPATATGQSSSTSSAGHRSPSVAGGQQCRADAIIEYKPFLTLRDILIFLVSFVRYGTMHLSIYDGTATPHFIEEVVGEAGRRGANSAALKWYLHQVCLSVVRPPLSLARSLVLLAMTRAHSQILQQMHKNQTQDAILTSHEAGIHFFLHADHIAVGGLILRDPAAWPRIKQDLGETVIRAVWPTRRPPAAFLDSMWDEILVDRERHLPSMVECVMAMSIDPNEAGAGAAAGQGGVRWIGDPVGGSNPNANANAKPDSNASPRPEGRNDNDVPKPPAGLPQPPTRDELADQYRLALERILGAELHRSVDTNYPLSFFNPHIHLPRETGRALGPDSAELARKLQAKANANGQGGWQLVLPVRRKLRLSTDSDATAVSTDLATSAPRSTLSSGSGGSTLVDLDNDDHLASPKAPASRPTATLPSPQSQSARGVTPASSTMTLELTSHLGTGRLYTTYKANVWFAGMSRPLWVVVKVCDLGAFPILHATDSTPDSTPGYTRADARRHILREVSLLTGALKKEQGRSVPKFHGLWTSSTTTATPGEGVGSQPAVGEEGWAPTRAEEQALSGTPMVMMLQEYAGWAVGVWDNVALPGKYR